MELKTVFNLKLPEINNTIRGCLMGVDLIIVGCGGTGSYFIQNISRVAKVLRETKNIDIDMLLYDADVVETKNLVRQNFTMKDIGRSKAESMAAKVSGGFQIPAKAFSQYLETPADVIEILTESYNKNHFPIIIGCVDSMQCRKIIDTAMKEIKFKAMWIDAGNEEFFGQVIINTVNGSDLADLEEMGIEEGFFNLPSFVDIAPELFEGNLQKTSEISCAEHAMENVQNIGANIFSANMLFMVVNNLLAGSGVSSSMIKFDARIMHALNTPITL
jgi:molybdopterin/thiamine biosynthesis adenylyltransferase